MEFGDREHLEIISHLKSDYSIFLSLLLEQTTGTMEQITEENYFTSIQYQIINWNFGG